MWVLLVIIILVLVGFAIFRRRQRYLQTRAKIRDFERRFDALETTIHELIDKVRV